MAAMPVGAGPLGAWLEPFAAALGRQSWRRAVVLVAGALLSPGRRTVAAALRGAGLGNAAWFRICPFRVTQACGKRRPVRAGLRPEGCPCGRGCAPPRGQACWG